MNEFVVRIEGRATLRAFMKAPLVIQDAVSDGVLEASLWLEREAKERAPSSGAGTLRNSIGVLPLERRAIGVTGGIGTSLAYAAPVELGSKPHMPPVAPIAEWVGRVIGIKDQQKQKAIAFAIAMKIRKRGTKPQLFMQGALEQGRPVIDRIIRAHLDRAIAKIGAGA